MEKFNTLDWVAIILLIVGALNWLLIGLFSFNLVEMIFGTMSLISRIIYVVVGLGGLYAIFMVSNWGRMRMGR